MKNRVIFILTVLLVSFISCTDEIKVSSPDGSISFIVSVEDGKAKYKVTDGQDVVLKNSVLGFSLLEDSLCFTNVEIKKIGSRTINETWEQVWGEDKIVKNHCNELTVRLTEKTNNPKIMDLIVRVFDDGFGFRYSFPEQEYLKDFTIKEELTEFCFTQDYLSWWLKQSVPYYEDYGHNTRLSQIDTAHTPFTIIGEKSRYMAIHEANLTNYAKMNLVYSDEFCLRAWLTPWSNGVKVYASTPFETPWRTMIIADNIAQLAASKIMLNLNEANKIEDTSWIKPGKYIGIWWTLHKDFHTWYYGPRHGATTQRTCEYIDFAAENNMQAVLVEGWNVGWDGDWMRNSENFNFTKAYPDYDFDKIMKYAQSKGVQMVIHNEYAANTEHYFSQIDSAYVLYSKYGMHYIKTGNVNVLMDGKEAHDGQYAVNRRRAIVEKAAQYKICVDEHEPAMPTGIHRTYPNLMTYEGVRGQEHDAWEPDGGNRPDHTTICPFIRGLAGPMDYTFGTFDFENPNYPFCRVRTTLAKQLAQYVVIYSPLQMASDDPSAYKNNKAFDFIREVPCDWYESHVIDAVIGDYVVTVRKDINSEDWYLGAITDENSRKLNVNLDFLDDGEYLAMIYTDGEDADYEHNPTSFQYIEESVNKNAKMELKLARSGGCAVRFVKMK